MASDVEGKGRRKATQRDSSTVLMTGDRSDYDVGRRTDNLVGAHALAPRFPNSFFSPFFSFPSHSSVRITRRAARTGCTAMRPAWTVGGGGWLVGTAREEERGRSHRTA